MMYQNDGVDNAWGGDSHERPHQGGTLGVIPISPSCIRIPLSWLPEMPLPSWKTGEPLTGFPEVGRRKQNKHILLLKRHLSKLKSPAFSKEVFAVPGLTHPEVNLKAVQV